MNGQQKGQQREEREFFSEERTDTKRAHTTNLHKQKKKKLYIYIYIYGEKCVFKDIFGKNICSSLCRKEGCVCVCVCVCERDNIRLLNTAV